MTSLCATCKHHESVVVWNKAIQGLLIFHTCKADGGKIFPQTVPIKHYVHYEEMEEMSQSVKSRKGGVP